MANARRAFLLLIALYIALVTLGLNGRMAAAETISRPDFGNGPAVQLSVGRGTSCILLTSGEVRCWGYLNLLGPDPPRDFTSAKPIRIPLPQPAKLVRTGAPTDCAILVDDSVYCWGAWGEHERNLPPTRFARNAADVVVAPGTACALHFNGTVSCWGSSTSGQLGNGLERDRYVAVPIPTLTNVKQLAATDFVFCALLQDSSVSCWGSFDAAFEVNAPAGVKAGGYGVNHFQPTPVRLTNVRALRLGFFMICALRNDVSIQCLTNGAACNSLPFPPALCRNFAAKNGLVTLPNKDVHDLLVDLQGSCIMRHDGSLRCREGTSPLEDGIRPALGNDTIHRYLRSVRQVSLGEMTRCAVLDGVDSQGMPNVVCWGANAGGEVGKPPKPQPKRPFHDAVTRPVKIVWLPYRTTRISNKRTLF